MRSEYADTVTRKWTRAEVDNIMQQLVFDANSSSLASEAMTLDAVDAEWMGEMMVLDSAVITTNMRTLNGKFTESISRTLTRKLSPDLSISGSEVGKVKKSGLYASIAAIFHVNDGQTVTIIFHAPDGDPKVISPDDTLIAFRVLMNKTDITSHVLPQLISIKGVTSLDQVSTNIASLLKANSETFKGKQAQIANQKKELEAKTAELRKLESAQVEAVQMEADAEKHMTDADEKGAGLESRIKRVEEDNAVLQEKIDKLKAKRAEVQPEPQPNAVSATPGKLDFVVSSLAKYGASLSPEGFIVSKTGTVTSVKPVVKGKRLRFEGKDSSLIASGATTEKFVSEFVERYWYWEKQKEAESTAPEGFDADAFDEKAKKLNAASDAVREMLDGIGYTEIIALAKQLGMKDSYLKKTGASADKYVLDQHPDDVKKACLDLGNIIADWEWVDDTYKDYSPVATEVQQEPEAKYIDWFVNYTTSANTGRTTDVSRLDSIIEALRTMPLKEYETAMDALIAELEDAGKLADHEAVLTEIDKARDEDLKKLVEGA